MSRPVRERMQVHRLRKKILEAVVPGSVKVEGYRDPETGQPFLNIECGFTVEGWELIEKPGRTHGEDGPANLRWIRYGPSWPRCPSEQH